MPRLIFAACCCSIAIATYVDADTRTIPAGVSIPSAIRAASPGDTLILGAGVHTSAGIIVDKAITLTAEPGAVLRRAGSYGEHCTGVAVRADGATVQGLRIEGFTLGLGSGKDRVSFVGNHTVDCSFHIAIEGNTNLVEGNEFERCIWRPEGYDDADYMRIGGTGHIIRRNWFHGTRLPGDIERKTGGYAHSDCIQFIGWTGAILHDITIEENFFMDFVQGLILHDETAPGRIRNITIRNNVFWGTTYEAPGGSNLLGLPSWMILVGKSHGARGIVIENNLLYRGANYFGLRSDTHATLSQNIVCGKGDGTVYAVHANSNASENIDERGGMLWGYEDMGPFHPTTNINRNPFLADESNPVGPDGRPFTADDGARPTNPEVAGFGPNLWPDRE